MFQFPRIRHQSRRRCPRRPPGRRPGAALLALALAMQGAACVSLRISSPNADGTPVVLQSADASCRPVDSFNQFYLLFGAAPLRTISPERMFPKADKSYRITEELKWYDMALTIVGGAFLSLTKNTVLVEECEGAAVFASTAQQEAYLQRQARERETVIAERLDRFVLEHSARAPAVLVLANGEVVGGKITSISEKSIVLEVAAREAAPDAAKKPGETSTPGTTQEKKQDSESATRVVPRRDVVKIEFPETP